MNRTAFEVFKDLVNSKPIDGEITRTEYCHAYNLERGVSQLTNSSMDTFRVYLTQLGYLEKMRRHGTFRIVRHVPEDLDLVQAIKDLKRKSLDEPLKAQVGGTHYVSKAYQPIEFIAKLKLSFIQGSIVKYITRYQDKNGLQDLQKALHYIEFAVPLGETKVVPHYLVREFTTYVKQNEISQLEGLIIREALSCHWDKAEMYCKQLIKVEYGVVLD